MRTLAHIPAGAWTNSRWARMGCALIFSILMAGQASAAVVINEIMYHAASDNPKEDFIELRNTGAAAVSLANWSINGVGFTFGAGASIPAGGFILVAQDATRFNAVYGFQPDFTFTGALSNSGETLKLIDSGGLVQDQVTYSDHAPWPTTPDGKGPSLELIDATQNNDDPRNWQACTAVAHQTAKAANSVQATGLPPWISNVAFPTEPAANTAIPVTAHVIGASSVTLTYKLDFGSDTTIAMLDDGLSGDGAAGDGVYGATIPGPGTASIFRFQILATGATGTMRYPRTDDTTNYVGGMVPDATLTSNLPRFHWLILPADYQQALATKFTDTEYPAVFFYNGTLYDNMRIRVRGDRARNFPKLHWLFKFPQGHDFSAAGLYPLPVQEIDMQGCYADKSYMREMLSYETYRDAGSPSRLINPVALFQNGAYYGLYLTMEPMEKEYLTRNGLDEEGAWYKAAQDFHYEPQGHLPPDYPKQNRTYEDYTDLYNLIDNVNNLSGQARRDYLFANLNIPAVINYLAATTIVHDNDHITKNYLMFRDSDGTQRWMIHAYDKDLTFGRNAVNAVLNDTIWANVDVIPGRPNVSPSHPLYGEQAHQKYNFFWNHLIDAVHAIPEFNLMYYRRLRTLMDDQLAPGRYEARIDTLSALLATEAARDTQKWGQYGTAQTLDQATTILKNDYLAVRRQHLFVTHRIPGEIPTTQSSAPQIVINEIMYNPASNPELEFIELFNPSFDESVDLSGWKLEGVDLTFPGGSVILPMSYGLVVRNDVEFRAAYGGTFLVLAQYPGKLDGGGENLVLKNRNDVVIDSVRYDDDAPWPTTADGGGPSLELIDVAQDNDRAVNWAPSASAGGTPGMPNSTIGTTLPVPGLWVNEVLPVNTNGIRDEQNEFSPWIEIYNSTGSPIDLSGMHLTNQYSNPTKWTFPNGTSLAGNSWLIVWADAEPGEGPLHTNFALSAAGGVVGLYTADAHIIDYLNYDPLPANVSFGKFPDGTNPRQEFAVPSPGAMNFVPPARLILNEYNGVKDDGFLKNGASDIYWGRVLGNGGDWFELVVVQDHLDIRGWKLIVSDNTGAGNQTVQTLTLTNNALWADMRAGTIITVSENLADDVSYDPGNGDWWINVRASSAGTGTYITAANFSVSNNSWQLTIRDAADAPVFGPAGEGVKPDTGIGNDEILLLDETPGPAITPRSSYKDGSDSTFGAPNIIGDGETQDFGVLRGSYCDPPPGFSDAGSNIASCGGGPVTLQGSSIGAISTNWASPGDGAFDNAFLLHATYTPGPADLAAGSVVLTLFANSAPPCSTVGSDTVTITFTAAPVANAGVDQTVCTSCAVDVTGTSSHSAGCLWATSGDGIFDHAGELTATYTPGAADIAAGSATLTLTCQPVAPCASPSHDSMVAAIIRPPQVSAIGGRYLSVKPPPDFPSVALRVESASMPCLPKYLDASGLLTTDPVFATSAAWGTIVVKDRTIVPGTAYSIRADVRTAAQSANLSSPATATTWVWGDVNNSGSVDISDIVCLLDGFQGQYPNCTLYGDDLRGNNPDGVIDVMDIVAVLDAFQGIAYPDGAPCSSGLMMAPPSGGPMAGLMLVPRVRSAAPGGVVRVDVFLSGAPTLRAYQLAFASSGGSSGRMNVETISIDSQRPDYAFAGLAAQSAVSTTGGKLANATMSAWANCSASRYLCTLTLRATADSNGTFVVKLGDSPATLLLDAGGAVLNQTTGSAKIAVIRAVNLGAAAASPG